MRPRIHVGTYARKGGAGLHSLSRSPDGGWLLGEPFVKAQNSSFGTYSSRHDLYYFVNEQSEGAVGIFREVEHGWEQLAHVPSKGAEPCYLALNGDETCIAVANYGSGNVAIFGLDDDSGVPSPTPDIRRNSGNGPDEDRQDGPHAHCACFSRDGAWLYVVDLGTDAVLAFPVDPTSGSIGRRNLAYRAPAGSGPRHLVLHPVLPVALLVSELNSTLTVLDVAADKLIARQTVSTLPLGFTGQSLGGHLSLNAAGDRAYVTNRGHDSVATFAWDKGGELRLLGHVPSGGASPRSFVLLEAERQLLLANEEGSNVVVFGVQADGTLSEPEAEIPVPGAVFLLVAPR